MPAETTPTRMLRLPEVLDRTGLARSTIYAMISRGDFPAPRKLTSQLNGWPEADVVEWLESRPVADSIQGPHRDAPHDG